MNSFINLLFHLIKHAHRFIDLLFSIKIKNPGN